MTWGRRWLCGALVLLVTGCSAEGPSVADLATVVRDVGVPEGFTLDRAGSGGGNAFCLDVCASYTISYRVTGLSRTEAVDELTNRYLSHGFRVSVAPDTAQDRMDPPVRQALTGRVEGYGTTLGISASSAAFQPVVVRVHLYKG